MGPSLERVKRQIGKKKQTFTEKLALFDKLQERVGKGKGKMLDRGIEPTTQLRKTPYCRRRKRWQIEEDEPDSPWGGIIQEE